MPVEVWGGFECSHVRVRDGIRDQIAETGHARRISDLDAVARLGIRTMRYPVLMEAVSPHRAEDQDWGWHDRRLGRLQELGISVIAGLIHHGSGPHFTDLLDPDFPRLLAAHASRTAQRYPWLDHFTPVNEPLTTARFMGLYGHWHPHRCDEGSFLRMLVAQCEATARAMRGIRRVSPHAKLVQTEDLGKIFAMPLLQYQADYENIRRWLSFDLLTGKIDRHHPFHPRLLNAGVKPETLDRWVDDPCPPDILGIDHYLTSDRFLDHRVALHPLERPGGNGRHRYVDIAGARAPVPRGELGLAPRLREVWERYGIPIVVSELHNGCTREEQVRWFMEGWHAANEAQAGGIDVRAITAWAMLGAVDWNSVLTAYTGSYEPGVFDVRPFVPRPTLLAKVIGSLVSEGRFDHPVLDRPGWWIRIGSAEPPRPQSRKLLLLGDGAGVSGFQQACETRALDCISWPGQVSAGELQAILESESVWGIVQVGEPAPEGGDDDGILGLSEAIRLAPGNEPVPQRLLISILREGSDEASPSARDPDVLHLKVPPSLDHDVLADIALDLLIDGERGNWRLARHSDGRFFPIDEEQASHNIRRLSAASGAVHVRPRQEAGTALGH